MMSRVENDGRDVLLWELLEEVVRVSVFVFVLKVM